MWSDRTYLLFILLNSTTVGRLVIRGLTSAKDFLCKCCTNYLAEGIVPMYIIKHIFMIVMVYSNFIFRTTIHVQNSSTFNNILFDL